MKHDDRICREIWTTITRNDEMCFDTHSELGKIYMSTFLIIFLFVLYACYNFLNNYLYLPFYLKKFKTQLLFFLYIYSNVFITRISQEVKGQIKKAHLF